MTLTVDLRRSEPHNKVMDKLLTDAEIANLNTLAPELERDVIAVRWGNNAGIRMAARRRLTKTVRG